MSQRKVYANIQRDENIYSRSAHKCSPFVYDGKREPEWSKKRDKKNRCWKVSDNKFFWSGWEKGTKNNPLTTNPCPRRGLRQRHKFYNGRAFSAADNDIIMACNYELNPSTLQEYSNSRELNSAGLDVNGTKYSLYEQMLFGFPSGYRKILRDIDFENPEGYCDNIDNYINIVSNIYNKKKDCRDKRKEKGRPNIDREFCVRYPTHDKCACFNVSDKNSSLELYKYCANYPSHAGCSYVLEMTRDLDNDEDMLRNYDVDCLKKGICGSPSQWKPVGVPDYNCTVNLAICKQIQNLTNVKSDGTINVKSECNKFEGKLSDPLKPGDENITVDSSIGNYAKNPITGRKLTESQAKAFNINLGIGVSIICCIILIVFYAIS